MADITMTQVTGTTHHYFASITVPAGPGVELTVDLNNALDESGNPILIPENIQADPDLDSIIEAAFEAKSTSVTAAQFKAGSLDPVAKTITVEITTTAVAPEADAVEMKFEFLHSSTR